MNRLSATELNTFTRKYRFAGGRLRQLKVKYGNAEDFTVDWVVACKTAVRDLNVEPTVVKVRIQVVGVEEFRFQKRPTLSSGAISDLRIGYFNGLFYITLDDMGLAPGEMPKIHDYRAGDHYLSGREIYWEEVAPKAE
jgi:hypothetical protein